MIRRIAIHTRVMAFTAGLKCFRVVFATPAFDPTREASLRSLPLEKYPIAAIEPMFKIALTAANITGRINILLPFPSFLTAERERYSHNVV